MDVQGCGRTDGGVHALGYAAHLEVVSDVEPETVAEMLNDTLPKDMAVLKAEAVDPRFHARHNCVARSYIYQLDSGNLPLPNAITGGYARSLMLPPCSERLK